MTQIASAIHELEGHWHYGENGLGPYHLLTGLVINEYDGYREFRAKIDGESWQIKFKYHKSGIAARDQDAADDRLYELNIHIDGYGERKANFNVSPRFEGMQAAASGESIPNPLAKYVSEGMDVHFQASNIDPEQTRSLLGDVVQAIGDDAGRRINNGYFRSDPIESSNIRTLEKYVRIDHTANRKLIGQAGLFRRIHHLLGSEKDVQADIRIDNEDKIGKMHRVRLRPNAAAKLHPELTFGTQLKSYLLKNPDAVDDDDPTYYPKVGALFTKSLNGKTKPWSERDRVQDQLDGLLLNALAWSEIPLRPDAGGDDAGVYVDDDHFQARPRSDAVRTYDDPTPTLEANQESLLVTGMRDMTDSDVDVLESIVTDGSGQDVDEIAANTDYHLSTIYRAMNRMAAFVENDDGIRFQSQKLADEISAIVRSTEHQIKNGADRVANLYNLADADSDAFRAWLNRYNAELVDAPDDSGRMKVRIDTVLTELKSLNRPTVDDVLDELRASWRDAGGDVQDVLAATIEYRRGPESWTNANPRTIDH